jgi:hypothetical protein
MKKNAPVSFTVQVGEKWLANHPDVELTDLADEAIRFSFRGSATPVEDIRIEQREHELAGGLGPFLDLQNGIDTTFQALRARLVSSIWPDGQPDADTPEAKAEQEEAIQTAWKADNSREKRGLVEMQNMAERIRFIAAWAVMIEDAPEGWADIATKPLDRNTLGWIRRAFADAAEDDTRGKTQPSA